MKFEGSFKNRDAQNLIYRASIPENPKASVIFVHGLGEHSLKYDSFAQRFYENGVSAFAYDQRGHGRSQGRRGHVDRFDCLIEDLSHFVDIVRVQTQREEVFLVGQSLGGLISLIFAIEYKREIKGVVVSSPALRLSNPPGRFETWAAKLIVSFVPALSVFNRVPFEYISHDEKAVMDAKRDRLSHRRISIRLYLEMIKMMRYAFDNASKINIPTLLLHGTGDKVTDSNATREFYEKLSLTDKEIKLYPDLYHELFREVEKEKIEKEIIDWVLKRA